jgi:hypothetical protein
MSRVCSVAVAILFSSAFVLSKESIASWICEFEVVGGDDNSE